MGQKRPSLCPELPEGLVSIGSVAFGECGSLASITIPKSVTEIGKNVFYENENLVIRVSAVPPRNHTARKTG